MSDVGNQTKEVLNFFTRMGHRAFYAGLKFYRRNKESLRLNNEKYGIQSLSQLRKNGQSVASIGVKTEHLNAFRKHADEMRVPYAIENGFNGEQKVFFKSKDTELFNFVFEKYEHEVKAAEMNPKNPVQKSEKVQQKAVKGKEKRPSLRGKLEKYNNIVIENKALSKEKNIRHELSL